MAANLFGAVSIAFVFRVPMALGALTVSDASKAFRFRETVTRFEPGRSIVFTIAVDPASIDSHKLDEHVAVGGPFFDVEYGEFRIESAEGGGVWLFLSSRHRLASHFSFYAGPVDRRDHARSPARHYSHHPTAQRARRCSSPLALR